MELRFSMASHSQTVGEMERVNGVLNQYLRNLVNVDQKDWADNVGRVEFSNALGHQRVVFHGGLLSGCASTYYPSS